MNQAVPELDLKALVAIQGKHTIFRCGGLIHVLLDATILDPAPALGDVLLLEVIFVPDVTVIVIIKERPVVAPVGQAGNTWSKHGEAALILEENRVDEFTAPLGLSAATDRVQARIRMHMVVVGDLRLIRLVFLRWDGRLVVYLLVLWELHAPSVDGIFHR